MASSKSQRNLLAALLIGIAVVGGLGSYLTFYRQAGTQITSTATSATTPVSTQITTQPKLFRLYGKLFFDCNGNGKQEPREPDVPDVMIALDGKNATSTNSTGWYVISDIGETVSVLRGYHQISIFPPKKFRYMCESDAEFRSVKESYGVSVLNDTREDIGLMEGFLTLPFPESVPINVDPSLGGDYFDHDPGPDAIWWNGQRIPAPRPHYPPNIHPGIDFFMPKGTPIKAALPGKIVEIRTSPGEPYTISLLSRYDYGTIYIHIDKPLVSVGENVKRGQIIALSGDTGSPGLPHLELQLWRHLPNDGKTYCIDPYSPVAGVSRGSWTWIAGTWEWFPSNDEWISQGYWTKFNDPQYYV